MATSFVRMDINGLPEGGGDPVATVTLTGMNFQAGQETWDAFVEDVKALIGAQQNVVSVAATRYDTVSTQI